MQALVHVVLRQGYNDRGCAVLEVLSDPLRPEPCRGYAENLAPVYMEAWLSFKKVSCETMQLETYLELFQYITKSDPNGADFSRKLRTSEVPYTT